MKDFYLTLISNSSTDIYPSNRTNSFIIQLPRKITLKEGHVVGIAEIQFPYNFFNVSEGNNTFSYIRGDYTYEGSITPGYYKSVTELIGQVLYKTREYLGKWLAIDQITNRIKIIKTNELKSPHPNSIDITNNIRKFNFHGRLAAQLGFSPNDNVLEYELSPYVGNVSLGIPDQMLLYCDLIEPQIVGYEFCQVLKIVNTTEGLTEFGTPSHRNFHKIHYIPLLKKEFDSVEINIRDITGKLFPFCHGIVMMKLHFKEKE